RPAPKAFASRQFNGEKRPGASGKKRTEGLARREKQNTILKKGCWSLRRGLFSSLIFCQIRKQRIISPDNYYDAARRRWRIMARCKRPNRARIFCTSSVSVSRSFVKPNAGFV